MSPFRSEKPRDADSADGDLRLRFFGPVRADRPIPIAAVLVSATLLVSIVLAALIGLNLLLPGGIVPLLLIMAEAAIRWPVVIAMPVIVIVLAWNARK